MILRQLFERESSTYTYLLADEGSGEAALIDPVVETVDRDLALVEELGLTLRYVLETHVHADHVTAAGELRRRTGAVTVGPVKGADCVDRVVRDGDVVSPGSLRVHVLETPGHTEESLTYRVDGELFTGDTLLIRGCGRTDFQNGDPHELYRSVTEKLFTLPDATRVWPGHDYKGRTVSTIGEEKRHNPRLSGKTEAEFVEIMNGLNLAYPKKIDLAVPANRRCGDVSGPEVTDAPA